MTMPRHNPRTPEVEVERMFFDRWSPRSFLTNPISYPDLVGLFEAARWSPSCNNEQPWLFVYAVSEADRERFAATLDEKNRTWASRAPVLVFILVKKNFSATDQPNRHAAFDTGAAWMALALQARRSGYYAHCMAGFNRKKAHKVIAASETEYDIIAAVAIGRRGNPEDLTNELKAKECPNLRKPLDLIVAEGSLQPRALQDSSAD